ncbi:MAG: hypothetical protein N3B18_00845, partial [Desulfobacterota bacterium]|nr:hypothetical protein [Thermodesulfobacteriota bacterium]
MTDINGIFFFIAHDYTHDDELWKSDGTPEGTVLVKDIYPGSNWSIPDFLIGIDGILYFTANDGFHGKELWKLSQCSEHIDCPEGQYCNDQGVCAAPACGNGVIEPGE